MFAGIRASASMVWALVLCVVAVAPHSAFAQPGSLVAKSIKLAAAPAPAAAGVSARSSKKIGMVTETLKDILQSVANEEKQEIAIFSKYTSWCQTEQTGLAKDLTETKRELGNAKVLSEEQVSTIEGLKLFMAKSEKEIEETKDSIAQADSLRSTEQEKYTDDMQINTQSLRQIDLAIQHVGKVNQQGGFLQNGVLKKLQMNQPGESSYVLGVMKGLKEKLEKSRVSMKKTEDEKVQMHDSFIQTKSSSLKAMTDKSVEKRIANTETNAKESSTKQRIGKLVEEVSKLVGAVDKTAQTCQANKNEWKIRQEDRTKEKAALAEAIRFLSEAVFEQLSLVQHDAEESDASMVSVPEFLQEDTVSKFAANEFYKAADAELNHDEDEVDAHTKKDTFNGVKSVVQKLIDSHQSTQKEEKLKMQYCEKEITAKDDEKTTTTDDLAEVRANIEKKSSEAEMLANEVKKIYESIDQLRKSVQEAGKVRKEEMAVFVAGKKDRALAIKVLRQAKSVLQNFYDAKQGNFLQQRANAAPAPAERAASPTKSSRKNVASFGAVSMVQDIADDIAKEQKDAASQETEAVAAFAKLQADSQQGNDEKQQDITDRVTAKAKLGVQINTLKETESEKSNDLSSINKQLDALHGSCDELLRFFDKRKTSRSFEVSQLRDVMDILSGSSIAARTMLTQDDAHDETPELTQDEAKALKALQ